MSFGEPASTRTGFAALIRKTFDMPSLIWTISGAVIDSPVRGGTAKTDDAAASRTNPERPRSVWFTRTTSPSHESRSSLNACPQLFWRKPGMHHSMHSGSMARAASAVPMSATSQPN